MRRVEEVGDDPVTGGLIGDVFKREGLVLYGDLTVFGADPGPD